MRVAAALLTLFLVFAARPQAWGLEAHRLIMDRAIDLLPPELKPLFEKHRAFVVERTVDPDMWRTAGWEAEEPNHFIDFDNGSYGDDPFRGLPRDYDAAVQKFGKEFVTKNGTVPWRLQEFYGMLERAFAALKRQPQPTYAVDNIVYYAAIMAHYAADTHVPLHSVTNYDGQLTAQNGIHSRWESELFARTRNKIHIAPAPAKPITNPRDFAFETLLASYRLSRGVLDADAAAAEGREFYDEAYFAAFEAKVFPALERRFNESITDVASLIIGAWEQAGRPPVPTDPPRTPRRIRRPNP